MKTVLLTTPQESVKARVREIFSSQPKGWRVEALASGALNEAKAAPDVILVPVSGETRVAEIKALVPRLARLQTRNPERAYVVFSLRRGWAAKKQKEGRSELNYSAVVKQINHDLRTFPNPNHVTVTFAQDAAEMEAELNHIGAKLDLPVHIKSMPAPADGPRPSVLDQVKEIVAATADLRAKSGKLSAEAIAGVFGVSLSQLAGWINRSRQAVSKTPDADSLQDELALFERIARLRATLPRQVFLKWLRMGNPELEDKRPLDLLGSADERQVLADLVDDMLTGAPA